MEQTIDPRLMRTILVMAVLTLPLKGWAIWRSVRNEQKGWYLAMFLINSLGLIELIYLFYFSKSAPKGNEQKL